MKRLPRMCRQRGCTAPTTNTSGRCDTHQLAKRREYHEQTKRYHSPEWAATRAVVLQRDHHQCVACAGTHRLTAHHVIPARLGGPDTPANLVTLCGTCHSRLESGDTSVANALATHHRAVNG